MNSETPALRLHGLSKSFGRIRAVDNLSLEVRPGEIVGFLGPNGAGKSTTLCMTTGLVHPSGGTIEIFGNDLRKNFSKAMSNVGAMVEKPSFYEYLSGRKNLELIARLHDKVSRNRIDEILKRIGLFDRRKDKVGTYSQGMKQRLGLGATLLGNPRLLLLDEPTNGMDPEATREILTFLKQQTRDESMAILLSSHLMYEVEEYCDRVSVINEGRLIASGNVREILTPHRDLVTVAFKRPVPVCEDLIAIDGIESATMLSHDIIEIKLSNKDSSWLNALLLEKGYEVTSLVPKQKTLRDFFLSVTSELKK